MGEKGNVVIDLFARNVVGWSMKPTLSRELVLDTLLMAVWRRKPVESENIKPGTWPGRISFDYIEMFYNRTRRHSHLGGVSPEAFEKASP